MEHKIIIQRLNTTRVNNGVPTEYPVEAFRGASFDGTPLILSQRAVHPSIDRVAANTMPPDYRIVGRISKSELVEIGTPRIEAMANVDDEDLSAKITAGEYAISSGFAASVVGTPGGQRITGNVIPNHVLMFPASSGAPNDGMAAFLNSTPILTEDGRGDNIISIADKIITNTTMTVDSTPQPTQPTVMSTANTAADVAVSTVNALTTQIEILNTKLADREAELAAKQADIAKLTQQAEVLTAENTQLKAQIEQDRKDREWAAISNAAGMPEALKGKRELFESKPHEFVAELLNTASRRSVTRNAEGVTVQISNTLDAAQQDQSPQHPTDPHMVSGYRVCHTFHSPDDTTED